MKLLLTVALVGCFSNFAGPVMAQGEQGEASGKDISSQCAHRRIMPPDPHDDCARKLRSDAQVGGGLGGASTTSSSYSQSSEAGPGNTAGPGSGGGQGNAMGPGSGGGQGKGRR